MVRGPKVPLAAPLAEREQALMRQVTELSQRLEDAQRAFGIFKAQHQPWRAGRIFGVVLMVSWNDYAQACRLLDWIRELGGMGEIPLMVTVPGDLSPDLVRALTVRAPKATIAPRPFPLSKEHWPQGPNWSFACASQWCHERGWDFLLLEPDAVPIRRGWLDGIAREYRGCGRPFMGHFEGAGAQHQPHLAGIAVYQWEIYQRVNWERFYMAWDVAIGPALLGEAHEARTIQQAWGTMDQPPTFPTSSELSLLRPDALLFHRCKDGTLIQRLREVGR